MKLRTFWALLRLAVGLVGVYYFAFGDYGPACFALLVYIIGGRDD